MISASNAPSTVYSVIVTIIVRNVLIGNMRYTILIAGRLLSVADRKLKLITNVCL